MEPININYFGEKFNRLQSANPDSVLNPIRKEGFNTFTKSEINISDINAIRLPGFENANELVFANGKFIPELSTIRSLTEQLVIMPLEEAAKGIYKELIHEHLDKSSLFIKDGIHALNTSFIYGGVFIYVNKSQVLDHPVYLYHISDVRENHTLSQPRSLVFVDQSAKLQLVETYS